MRKDINIADITVHLHPKDSCDDKDTIEQGLRDHDGVISVHFDQPDHPHSMVVAYNPDVVTSGALLADIRKCDKHAVMLGI